VDTGASLFSQIISQARADSENCYAEVRGAPHRYLISRNGPKVVAVVVLTVAVESRYSREGAV